MTHVIAILFSVNLSKTNNLVSISDLGFTLYGGRIDTRIHSHGIGPSSKKGPHDIKDMGHNLPCAYCMISPYKACIKSHIHSAISACHSVGDG